LTTNPAFETGATFSPDGKFLVFAREEDGYSHIFRLDLSTMAEEQLTFGRFVDSVGSISPDAKALSVYRGHYQGGLGLQAEGIVVNIADPKTPISAGTFAVFSRDNETIFYDVRNTTTDQAETWAMDRQGGNRRPMCAGTVIETFGDVKSLLLRTADNQNCELLHLATGQRESLFPIDPDSPRIVLAGTEEDIVFTRNYGNELWRCHIADKTIHRIDIGNAQVVRKSRCKDGVLLVCLEMEGERCGAVYFVDGSSWKVRRLFSVDK